MILPADGCLRNVHGCGGPECRHSWLDHLDSGVKICPWYPSCPKMFGQSLLLRDSCLFFGKRYSHFFSFSFDSPSYLVLKSQMFVPCPQLSLTWRCLYHVHNSLWLEDVCTLSTTLFDLKMFVPCPQLSLTWRCILSFQRINYLRSWKYTTSWTAHQEMYTAFWHRNWQCCLHISALYYAILHFLCVLQLGYKYSFHMRGSWDVIFFVLFTDFWWAKK